MSTLLAVPAKDHEGHIAEHLFAGLRFPCQFMLCNHKRQIFPQGLKFVRAKNLVQFVPERRLFGALFLFVHRVHPFLSVRFIGLRLWYAGIALCFPIFGIFLPIYCAILFFERNILTFVAQSVKIVVKGQLALALTFMESRYGDG